MDVTPLVPHGHQVINSYGAGGFMISGERRDGSVLVFPEQIVAFEPKAWSDLTLTHLLAITEVVPTVELLLMGCGPSIQPLSMGHRAALREAGIGIDLMDTGAACRTYNILMAEGRRVAAALIALNQAHITACWADRDREHLGKIDPSPDYPGANRSYHRLAAAIFSCIISVWGIEVTVVVTLTSVTDAQAGTMVSVFSPYDERVAMAANRAGALMLANPAAGI